MRRWVAAGTSVAAATALVVSIMAGAGAVAASAAPNPSAGTGSISGSVTSERGDGAAAPGVVVTAYTVASDGSLTAAGSAVAHDDGTSAHTAVFDINGLAAGSYRVEYVDGTRPGTPSGSWYQSSITAYYGSLVTVANSTATSLGTWQVEFTGEIRGTVSCEGCSNPRDPAGPCGRVHHH